MGQKIPEDVIQRIKDLVNIREVVEDYVTLKKDGANHKGLCPFHQEKTPSFKVHEGKGIFKCFGCGESGNVINFVMKLESMSFPQAVEKLAARAGIDLPRVEETPEQKKHRQDLERMFAANQAAAEFYHLRLKESQEAKSARDYLAAREINEDSIDRYLLGYSPDSWDKTLSALKNKGVSENDMHDAGLVIERDSGGYYDRFRGRLMFPIMDVEGRVRGFGARRLIEDNDQPKYINSPETAIFKKGAGFFGIRQSRPGIRKEGRVIVVEGYTDQMALDAAGIDYSLATLGTALTVEHAQVIRRYGAEAFVVFDADEAGEKASLRALEVFLEVGVSPRIVTMPEGKDPDDFLKKNGSEDFKRLIDGSPPLLSWYIDKKVAEAGDSPSGISGAVSASAEMIARVKDPIERSVFVERLARKAGVPVHKVETRVRPPRRRADADRPDRREAVWDPVEFSQAELDLVRILIHHPESAARIRETEAFEKIRNSGLRDLVKSLLGQEERTGRVEPAALLHLIPEPDMADRLSAITLEPDPFEGIAERALEDILRLLLRTDIESRLTDIRRRISEAQEKKDAGAVITLIKEQQALMEQIKSISSTGPAGN